MPLFVVYGLDGPKGLEIRKATRQSHLDWIAAQTPRVKAAGPMYAEDGSTPVGSMFIIEADSLAAANAMCAEDPYTSAGLWARLEIRPYNWIIRQ